MSEERETGLPATMAAPYGGQDKPQLDPDSDIYRAMSEFVARADDSLLRQQSNRILLLNSVIFQLTEVLRLTESAYTDGGLKHGQRRSKEILKWLARTYPDIEIAPVQKR